MYTIPSYFIWLIFVTPYVGALATAALRRAGRISNLVAVASSFVSAVFALTMLVPVLTGQELSVESSVIPQSVNWISFRDITVGVLSDPYTAILANVVGWVSFLIMVYSLEYMKEDGGSNRYFFFVSLFVGSMQLIVLSDNLLSLFIGWEMVGLCSYALIGHYWKDETKDWVGTPGDKALGEDQSYSPSHAGMKAFVMTRVGDVAMLAGILILYVYAGTFNYHALAATSVTWIPQLSNAGLLVPVALLIFGGAVGKSAQFPLQEWLPDAMAGPAPVSALIHAATMVKAGVVLVARIAPIFYLGVVTNNALSGAQLVEPFFATVAWIGAFTAILAASQALVGFELKKILAYSTMSQIGYMMMAIGVAGLAQGVFVTGLSAGLFHLLSHAIFKACLFLAAGALIHSADTKYINEMGGMRSKMKVTFAAVLIAAASLSGIPQFSGFWSKDAVLGAAWDAGQFPLFAVGVITAGLTAFYSFRMLGIVFYGGRSNRLEAVEGQGHHVHEPSPIMWVPYAILALATVVIGFGALVGEFVPTFGMEAVFRKAADGYINGSLGFSSLTFESGGIAVVPSLIALLFVGIGFGAASWFYILRRSDPGTIIGQSGAMRSLYIFLEKRWYINALYYKVFVDAPISMARWLSDQFDAMGLFKVNEAGSSLGVASSRAGNWLDVHIVDGAANGFSSAGQSLSRFFRKAQTGIVENYIQVFAVGVILLVIALLLGIGVKLP